ncbi:MAG: nucleotide sugar dehydrogenase [Desulfobacteraceae bacterium]|nr:nucleotide sugar dehydrogenase [Desulfobacteraceae bacterium]
MLQAFLDKVKQRRAQVGVVGLGYVGLPLAIEFVKAGFPVLGLDVDAEKIRKLESSDTYIQHIPSSVLQEVNASGRFQATSDFSRSISCDAVIICVPTPLDHHREPDLSFVVATAETLGPFLQRGQLFSLESTTYPGTSDEVLQPVLEEKSGMEAGKDFFLAYSPEREDPNNLHYTTSTIPKVVGGHDNQSLRAAQALYDAIVCRTVPVSSMAVAEATKLMENIFRSVNIALVNELKMVFQTMGIDIWEVIAAAKTKPFGFMPFYPGPGLGGHCIPIDPFYLTWKAREFDIPTRFIELAGEINTRMPYHVVQQTMEIMNDNGIALKGSRLLLAGLAYKKNVDDIRESPALKLWRLFEDKGARVAYHDPFVPVVPKLREYPEYIGRTSVEMDSLNRYDAIVVCTDHDDVDYQRLVDSGRIVIDTRNTVPTGPNVYRC